MELRPYQQDLYTGIYEAWRAGHRNVLAVLCTGGGKTCIFSKVIHSHQGASCAIAHRQELVGQISLALGREGVKHRIIGPKDVVKACIQAQIEELGRDFYDPGAPCAVAGVDTIVSWMKPESKHHGELLRWSKQVTLWVLDEAHHPSGCATERPDDFVTGNKWCKAVSIFTNAHGLGVTATPERADGKGLGRGKDGIFDTMIVGPNMRDLISMKYLSDYRVFCPPSDLDLSTVSTGADGDYIRGQLALSTRKSSVMGDVVEHYIRIANGKLGVTFTPDVETAGELAARFIAAGVPAEAVSAKTPDRVRREILRKFKQRKILQLVNCQLFDEGFDLPAIEVISMARATQSYGMYTQQFGRSLRILEGKDRALIIDHVGNVIRHGLPDRPREWSLDRRERRSSRSTDPDMIPMRICTNPVCMAPYEAIHPTCPFCGQGPAVRERSRIEMVDGDLYELDAATLAAMRGEIARVDKPAEQIRVGLERGGMAPYVAIAASRNHAHRQNAQAILRDAMALWAGYRVRQGDTEQMAHRRFFFQFGTDVLSAQVLGRAEAEALALRLYSDMWRVAGRV